MKLKKPSLKMLWTRSLYGLIAVALTACGSTYNTTDADGIYGEDTTPVVAESDNAEENDEAKNSYYKQYFKTKSQSLDEIPEEDVIFTDIEAYSSNESLDEEGYVVVEETGGYNGYAGWGDNTTDVSVNVYGGYGGWGWGGGWGIGFGWGWGNPYWGWGGAWGYPYWGWGGYWGWYGGYNPWYCAYPTPYYYNNYGHGGYAYSYNRGRRNSDYLAARSSRGAEGYARSNTSRVANRSTTGRYSRTAGRYGRSEMARRSNVRSGRYASMRNSARGNTARYNPNNRSNYRSSRGNTVNRSRSSVNRNYNRNNMRNTNRSRPARSYSRPSGSMRSSGGGYRGGGGSRGGGRAGGGRGGRG